MKRIFGLLLLVGGLIALIWVIMWLLSLRKTIPSLEPEKLPTQNPIIDTTTGRQVKEVVTPVAVDPQSPQEKERQLQELLKRQGMAFAARFGTYANTDDFASWRELGIDITAGVQPFLESEAKRLSKEHPLKDGYWGQTTKSLSARLTSELPIGDKTEAEVTIQAQQTVSQNAANQVTYQEIILSYRKVNNAWLVSRITSKPLAL